MNNLSSPVELIQKSFRTFFEKEKMVYLLKIYSIPFILALFGFVFGMAIGSLGYESREFIDQISKGNPLIILYAGVWSIVSFVIGLWAQASGYEAVKRVAAGGVLEFRDTYKASWKLVWKFFLVSILIVLAVLGGLVLLIIPAVIFGVWFSFSYWRLIEGRGGAVQSMKESKALVKGRFWKVFGRLIVFGLFSILGQIMFSVFPYNVGPVALTIFGGLFLLPYYLLYRELASHKN